MQDDEIPVHLQTMQRVYCGSSYLSHQKHLCSAGAEEMPNKVARAVVVEPPGMPLFDYPAIVHGIDTFLLCPILGAVELRNEVVRAVAMELPGTLVFDYPTIDAIVGYIAGKVAAAAPAVAQTQQEQGMAVPGCDSAPPGLRAISDNAALARLTELSKDW